MMDVKRALHVIGERIKRMNRLVLAFPVWLVLGVSGLFHRFDHEQGWQDSELNDRWERMY